MNDHWEEKHKRYKEADWIGKPSIFAEFAVEYFPPEGKILDFGAGQGQDALFFAKQGYQVIGMDSSENAIAHAKESIESDIKDRISFEIKDFSNGLSFEYGSFDVVYSHLALHYFDRENTAKLFDEIYRVLKPGGILAFLVNSTRDPEIKEFTQIEEDYYDTGKIRKRFFDVESVKEFANKFEVIVADNEGETYKDRAIGTANLIRFVGRKI